MGDAHGAAYGSPLVVHYLMIEDVGEGKDAGTWTGLIVVVGEKDTREVSDLLDG